MKKINISKDWYFKEVWRGANPEWYKVDLPHDYAVKKERNALYSHANGFYDGGTGRYVKYIKFDQKQHTILDIDGAYMCAEICINENFWDMHPHGYTPYLVDMTDWIKPNHSNRICIRTSDMQPSSRWYSGAGIYRDVFLWTGGDVRIEPWDLYVTTECATPEQAEITIHVWVSSDYDCGAQLQFKLGDLQFSQEVACKANGKTEVHIPLVVKKPNLWDLDNPYLYDLTANVVVNGEILDTFTQKVGLRVIRVSAENGFTLNGKSIKLKGGCIHHDHGGLGAAAYPAAEERKIKKLMAAGFNAVRISHNPPSLALMEVCDRLGMLVLDEAFDMWNIEKKPNDYHLFFRDWCLRDISYMVRRDRSHPCIISYSIGNEIIERDGRYNGGGIAKMLADEVRKYDTSRPVTSAICGLWAKMDDFAPADYEEIFNERLHEASDVDHTDGGKGFCDVWTKDYTEPLDMVGYNYLHGRYDYDVNRYPNRVIWGSETWALTFYDSWTGVMKHNNVIGDFVWTAIDNIGETGAGRVEWGKSEPYLTALVLDEYPWRTCYQGDLDLSAFRRPQSYFREAIWKDGTSPYIFTTHPKHYGEPFSGTLWHWYDVQDNWNFEDKYIGKPCTCEVYTTADQVRFILNGKEMGVAKVEKAIARLDIPYEKGVLQAEAIKDGKVVGNAQIKTVGEAVKVAVVAEKTEIAADNRDLCYFDIQIQDQDGNRIPVAETEISAVVNGGELLCIFSGHPKNEDAYGSGTCHTFLGHAVAVVRTNTPGAVRITVGGKGLDFGEAQVLAK